MPPIRLTEIPIKQATVAKGGITLLDYCNKYMYIDFIYPSPKKEAQKIEYMCRLRDIKLRLNHYNDLVGIYAAEKRLEGSFSLDVNINNRTIPFCICIAKKVLINNNNILLDECIDLPITDQILSWVNKRNSLQENFDFRQYDEKEYSVELVPLHFVGFDAGKKMA